MHYQLLVSSNLILLSFSSTVSSSNLMIDTHSQGVDKGATATLRCQNTGTNTAVSVKRWELNGHQLDQTSGHITIGPTDTKQSLTIKSANQSDSGNYCCFADINGVVDKACLLMTVYRK